MKGQANRNYYEDIWKRNDVIDNENYLCLLVLKSPVEDPAFEQPSEKNGWTFLQQKVFFSSFKKKCNEIFLSNSLFPWERKKNEPFLLFSFLSNHTSSPRSFQTWEELLEDFVVISLSLSGLLECGWFSLYFTIITTFLIKVQYSLFPLCQLLRLFVLRDTLGIDNLLSRQSRLSRLSRLSILCFQVISVD